MGDSPVFLTAEQLAARWQVKPSQVYRLSREGALDGVLVQIGRYYRYRVDALEEWERGTWHAVDTPSR